MMDLYKQWRLEQEPFVDDIEFVKQFEGPAFAKSVFVELFRLDQRISELEKEFEDD